MLTFNAIRTSTACYYIDGKPVKCACRATPIEPVVEEDSPPGGSARILYPTTSFINKAAALIETTPLSTQTVEEVSPPSKPNWIQRFWDNQKKVEAAEAEQVETKRNQDKLSAARWRCYLLSYEAPLTEWYKTLIGDDYGDSLKRWVFENHASFNELDFWINCGKPVKQNGEYIVTKGQIDWLVKEIKAMLKADKSETLSAQFQKALICSLWDDFKHLEHVCHGHTWHLYEADATPAVRAKFVRWLELEPISEFICTTTLEPKGEDLYAAVGSPQPDDFNTAIHTLKRMCKATVIQPKFKELEMKEVNTVTLCSSLSGEWELYKGDKKFKVSLGGRPLKVDVYPEPFYKTSERDGRFGIGVFGKSYTVRYRSDLTIVDITDVTEDSIVQDLVLPADHDLLNMLVTQISIATATGATPD